MKKYLLVTVLLISVMCSCSAKNVEPLDDGNVDLSKIQNDISSQILLDELTKQPVTVTSYNDKYTLIISRRWKQQEKGTLSDDENSIFECVMYSNEQINSAFYATEYFESKDERKTAFLENVSDYEEFVSEKKNIEYVVFSREEGKEKSKAGYYVFFIETNDGCVQLMAKCNEVDIASYKQEFESVAESFKAK